jgi:hypothetical protein
MISMFAQMGKQRAVTFDLSTYLTFFFGDPVRQLPCTLQINSQISESAQRIYLNIK